MTATQHKGGCLCGAIRYVASGAPKVVAYCHCPSCRRSAGAPVTAWAMFEIKDFRIEKGKPITHASSPGVERSFCGQCGTPLTYTGEGIPGLIDVTVGSFDEPNGLPPQLHIWDSKKISWIDDAGALSRHAELPSGP